MDFRIYGDKSLLQDAQNVITDLEKKVSVTDSDSEIYKINENGSGILSGGADTLMKNTLEMCRRTNGALDISIYPIVKAWGFTTGSYQVPDEETIQTASDQQITHRSNMTKHLEMSVILNRTDILTGILWILLPDTLPRAGFCPSQSQGTKEKFAMPSPLRYLLWVWIKPMTSGRKVMISKPCS